jgi:hypothetical protein
MRINIRRAAGEADLERVARFRYTIYVDEVGVRLPSTDHARRIIREPLDDWGTVIIAEDPASGALLGTIRVNYAWHGSLGSSADNLGMRQFGSYFPGRSALTSRLIVHPAQRCGRTTWALIEAAFTDQVRAGVVFSFGECRPERRAWLIGRAGFRQIFPSFRHPTDGIYHPLVLPLEDADHLARMGSPLRRVVRNPGGESVQFFRKQFGPAPDTGDAISFHTYLSGRLHDADNDQRDCHHRCR